VLLIGLALREASRLVFGAVLFFRNPDKAAEPSVLSVKAFHCGGLKGTPVRRRTDGLIIRLSVRLLHLTRA
jgi:hypothetical protein